MQAIKYIFLFIIILNSVISSSQIQNPKKIEYQWRTDLTINTIDLSEIQAVLPRGSFPRLDYPKFINKNAAEKYFYKNEPVISIEINGEAKAYPLSILTVHEILNDLVGGVPVLPAYCPLCNTAVVFDRRLKAGEEIHTLQFEVSGMLRKSNLILYDFLSETWWQHLTGEGIVGEYAGRKLTLLPSQIISVEEFFNSYPKGKILSHKTGSKYEKKYGTNPYEKYDDPKSLPYARFFKEENINVQLPAMERVVNLQFETINKIYPYSIIKEKGIINDKYKDQDIVIFYKKGTISVLDNTIISESRDIGSVTVYNPVINKQKFTFLKKNENFIDTETGSEWDITGLCINGELKGKKLDPIIHGIHFAFAWLAFYPESIIYSEE